MLATAAAIAYGVTGLVRCSRKPAASACRLSCGRPYAVTAITGISPPFVAGPARELRHQRVAVLLGQADVGDDHVGQRAGLDGGVERHQRRGRRARLDDRDAVVARAR